MRCASSSDFAAAHTVVALMLAVRVSIACMLVMSVLVVPVLIKLMLVRLVSVLLVFRLCMSIGRCECNRTTQV